MNERIGKATSYFRDGRVLNSVFEFDETYEDRPSKYVNKLVSRNEAYYVGGIPNKALTSNWREYIKKYVPPRTDGY